MNIYLKEAEKDTALEINYLMRIDKNSHKDEYHWLQGNFMSKKKVTRCTAERAERNG